jgi:hypothetical protein
MRSRDSLSGRTCPERRASASSRNRALFASRACGEVRDRGGQAVVECLPARLTARPPGERAELDDLLRAPATLDESGPNEEEDADRADDETDEECDDDHRVDER